MVDATATLLAFHQTGSDGEKAGLKSKNGDVNIMRIGQFNYESGFTTSAQRETRFIVDEICNRTEVMIKSRRIKRGITTRVSIPPTNRAMTSEIPDSHKNNLRTSITTPVHSSAAVNSQLDGLQTKQNYSITYISTTVQSILSVGSELARLHTKRIIRERLLGRFRAVARIPKKRRRRVIGRRI